MNTNISTLAARGRAGAAPLKKAAAASPSSSFDRPDPTIMSYPDVTGVASFDKSKLKKTSTNDGNSLPTAEDIRAERAAGYYRTDEDAIIFALEKSMPEPEPEAFHSPLGLEQPMTFAWAPTSIYNE